MRTIHRILRWPWSKWTDILTFTYGNGAYLLQGRVNMISGRKQFAVRSTNNRFGLARPFAIKLEDVAKITKAPAT